MDYLKNNQLDIMLVLIGVCGILAILALFMKNLSKKRRRALISLEFSVMVLLIFDRLAYLYRGNTDRTGFAVTGISNFLVFFFSLYIIHAVNLYLADLLEKEGHVKETPKLIIAVEALLLLGVALLVISQFTGFYYTFDAQNHYQREQGFIISYFIPLAMTAMQLIVLAKYRSCIRKRVRIPLVLFMSIPYIASIVQFFYYGVSLTNLTTAGLAVVLYAFALWDMADAASNAHKMKIRYLKEEQKKMLSLFEETAEALVSAIDAKDRYTRGHSSRVAKYSQRIARLAGMDEGKCAEIYLAGLLHDVGKIGIPDSIINKDRRLTDEEYAVIKTHPEIGYRILSKIKEAPYLNIGAHYHHERYDGKGYPDGLKKNEIPLEARIISVADAYDTMTSRRSYRNPIPQTIAREEFVKGSGTQFDPEFAQIMLQLIDQDVDYSMKDNGDLKEFSMTKRLQPTELGFTFSQGVRIMEETTTIRFRAVPDKGGSEKEGSPVLLLYDSEDKMIHTPGEKGNTAEYVKYAEIRFDGSYVKGEARKIVASGQKPAPIPEVLKPVEAGETGKEQKRKEKAGEKIYEVQAVRCRDHVGIILSDGSLETEVIVALPYAASFSYMAIMGTRCLIDCIEVERSENKIGPEEIPRIAEEIRFTDGPQGDLPNFQIDGYRLCATKGIPVTEELRFTFHTMSLPMAKLVWHCPYLVLFDSEDGSTEGENYRELALIRLDGESCPVSNLAKNRTLVAEKEEFGSWNSWKERNREGLDGWITLSRKGDRINTETELGGLGVRVNTKLPEGTKRVYAALTGDLIALTNIRVTEV